MDVRSLYSPPQLKLLDEFKNLLWPTLTEAQKKWCDDACLLRYLRAREWKIPKSEKMIRDTLEWREQYKPWAITWDEVNKGSETGKMYRYGYDKEGHPVLILQPRLENLAKGDATRPIKMKLLVYTLERIVDSMPPGVEKLVLLIDFKGYSSSNAPDLKTSKETLNILSNHYPERLHRAVCLRPPWFFYTFYKMIGPFVDPVTRQKVVFKKDSHSSDLLWEIFPKDQLEEAMGGTSKFTYDHKSYTMREKELATIRSKAIMV
mmetsp:Transcript_23180/g.38136  ORF Transcript_23180/g.38136 Transcript_23180/m.38136 type:complete len:262 (-) Transcript_23180:482-1267(-)|eukprot:CAMPEP_0184645892 /NCGR_PEP_ID=MMETSP0308-20130426/2479_1 /TAXON_ID=38269 /ORGANISM="Gloeochaete witrockiana, Strain SAG 46.84" /LENGTH=261 /DNA_ID=CAMNT_0027075363 /DNA_START=88 /DNA_END=873 /DNA_ORIENTATION=-